MNGVAHDYRLGRLERAAVDFGSSLHCAGQRLWFVFEACVAIRWVRDLRASERDRQADMNQLSHNCTLIGVGCRVFLAAARYPPDMPRSSESAPRTNSWRVPCGSGSARRARHGRRDRGVVLPSLSTVCRYCMAQPRKPAISLIRSSRLPHPICPKHRTNPLRTERRVVTPEDGYLAVKRRQDYIVDQQVGQEVHDRGQSRRSKGPP